MSRERRIRNFQDGYDMTWSKVPDGVVYTASRIMRP